MTMTTTPKGMRLHIALFGRRNVGKSSLLNALARQDVAIVSDTPGTTTDPVEKVMEFAPLGPVVFVDTAGLDDVGALGRQRAERSLKLIQRVDVALLVTDGIWGEEEAQIAARLVEQRRPFAVLQNKADLVPESGTARPAGLAETVPVIRVSAKSGLGLEAIRMALAGLVPESALEQPPLLHDLLPEHGLVVLVVPIDTGAPRGRLILPQVQAIRDSLDGRKLALVSTEGELPLALSCLQEPPALVVCDSQVVHQANAVTPDSIPLTTFSVLMARLKGDLAVLARGAAALTRLEPGDPVQIQEACSHHPQKDDIAQVKLPRLLTRLAGGPLDIGYSVGKAFPEYRQPCRVVVHCGGCVLTRGQMLTRLHAASQTGVPMTNYGMAISLAQGVLQRVLSPFPAALASFNEARASQAR